MDGEDIKLAEVEGPVADLVDRAREELGIEVYINESRRIGEARSSSVMIGLHVFPFFYMTDGCPDDVTTVQSNSTTGLDLKVFWTEQPFGGLAELPCPCDAVSLPLTASRRCAWGVGGGVDWAEPDDSQCNFSGITRILCSLPDVSKHVINRIILLVSQFTLE